MRKTEKSLLKQRSPPALRTLLGQVTKHTTAEWFIGWSVVGDFVHRSNVFNAVLFFYLLGSIPRGMSPPSRVRKERMTEKEDREKAPKPEAKRIRQFRSKHWKLEPRVRFLSWAGKNMDPVNIDWVLQKLGFSHAQLTIPKWAQRGAMDPMDSFLSLLVDRLLAGMQESASYLGDEN